MRIRSSAAIGLMLNAALLWPAVQGSEQDRLDAVIAAPSNHTIIFENERVRVLRVTIAPGATEPMHTHAWPSVMRVEAPQTAYQYKLFAEGRQMCRSETYAAADDNAARSRMDAA